MDDSTRITGSGNVGVTDDVADPIGTITPEEDRFVGESTAQPTVAHNRLSYSAYQRQGVLNSAAQIPSRVPYYPYVGHSASNFNQPHVGLPGITVPCPTPTPIRSAQEIIGDNLRRFNAVWGSLLVEDTVTRLWIDERQVVMSHSSSHLDLGVFGPQQPASPFPSSDVRDDVFDRFVRDGLHWDQNWKGIPTEGQLMAHHIRLLRMQKEWLLRARESTFLAYESQLQVVNGLLERGELRSRGSFLGGPLWGGRGEEEVPDLLHHYDGPSPGYGCMPVASHVPAPAYRGNPAGHLDVRLALPPRVEAISSAVPQPAPALLPSPTFPSRPAVVTQLSSARISTNSPLPRLYPQFASLASRPVPRVGPITSADPGLSDPTFTSGDDSSFVRAHLCGRGANPVSTSRSPGPSNRPNVFRPELDVDPIAAVNPTGSLLNYRSIIWC